MEEELNEDELEERLYAMIHYADDTQTTEHQNDFTANPTLPTTQAPTSTLRRYWRPSTDLAPANTTYHKVNAAKPTTLPTNPQINNVPKPNNPDACVDLTEDKTTTKPKEETQSENTSMLEDLSILNGPISGDTQITVQIVDNDESANNIVELETSDEDEVVEVALPPKPTITIESSEDEDSAVEIIPKKSLTTNKTKKENNKATNNADRDREVSASPVPSIVSSVSDEFIRGDCIALNISSRHPANHSFDFSLHGADLATQSTPSKTKKKKKKNKEQTSTASLTITDIVTPEKPTPTTSEGYFATPKSKSKKKQKNKVYQVAEKSIPNPDVYDSDSNNSFDVSKKQTYTVTDKSCPNVDLYESDSSQSVTKDSNDSIMKENIIEISDDIDENDLRKPAGKENNQKHDTAAVNIIDENQDSSIEENIFIANVINFKDYDDYYDGQNNNTFDTSQLGSTNVPSILFEDLDFDFLKGKGSSRRFSLETLRSEMQKFYNESWGGENFNHRELQKTMSRDKSLWEIDPKDKLPLSTRRKITCHYCGRMGHKDDICRLKPAVCHMCGTTGHYGARCPNKICVNCGSPNGLFTDGCRYCATWTRGICAECGQRGHPSSHCPDLWRRYHNTIDNNTPLEELTMFKREEQHYCSGCARRGHLVHTCRVSGFFSSLPVNSPYVFRYQPIYPPTPKLQFPPNTPKQDATPKNNKRQSKSPTCHENHQNKKKFDNKPKERRNSNRMSLSDSSNNDGNFQRGSKEKDFIKVPNYAAFYQSNKSISSNTDKNGQVIQDNQVSDTSAVTTTARIYIKKDVVDKLNTDAGIVWLREKMTHHKLEVELPIGTSIVVKGMTTDQEAFQNDLRELTNKDKPQTRPNSATKQLENNLVSNIPKKKNMALRQLTKAFEMLEEFQGEPKALYKELNYHQNNREKLLKQKIISPKQLANNRDLIRGMVKKLNMVLLGQAGLADGPAHLSKLQSMLEKLTAFRNKTVPIGMRKEIGQHYNYIFTALPRDDYENLINIYYSKPSAPIFNTIKKKPKKIVTPFSHAMRNTIDEMAHDNKALKSKHTSDFLVSTMRGAGVSYKMLKKCKPGSDQGRKARVRIARLLHDQMANIKRKQGDVTLKQLKNVSQTTERVNAFMKLLTN